MQPSRSLFHCRRQLPPTAVVCTPNNSRCPTYPNKYHSFWCPLSTPSAVALPCLSESHKPVRHLRGHGQHTMCSGQVLPVRVSPNQSPVTHPTTSMQRRYAEKEGGGRAKSCAVLSIRVRYHPEANTGTRRCIPSRCHFTVSRHLEKKGTESMRHFTCSISESQYRRAAVRQQ